MKWLNEHGNTCSSAFVSDKKEKKGHAPQHLCPRICTWAWGIREMILGACHHAYYTWTQHIHKRIAGMEKETNVSWAAFKQFSLWGAYIRNIGGEDPSLNIQNQISGSVM